MLGATVTRPLGAYRHAETWERASSTPTDEQLAVSCIAGVVTFKLEDGTTIEVDEAAVNGALFFAAHEDAA